MPSNSKLTETLRALGIREGDVVQGPWGKKEEKPSGPTGQMKKISLNHTFGPGHMEDSLAGVGSDEYGHRFMEKPGYPSDLDAKRNTTTQKAINSVEWNLPEYEGLDLFGVHNINQLRSLQVPFSKEPEADYFVLHFDDGSYLCYQGARKYIRFWMRIH